MTQYNPIAELQNFIVLDNYTKRAIVSEPPVAYQTEAALERELIDDLKNQGYEYLPSLVTPDALLANVREQLQTLNNVVFTDREWQRFVDEYLDKASDSVVDKTRRVQDDYIYDFVFDNGGIQNIYLVDKQNIARNKVQVINQFEQTGTQANRYDVTILVNGLPMVQVELKKRGVAIREAFNQVHRYSKESFNSESSLYKYLQIFVISNGTDTRYFANTVKRNKNSFDFTMNWAKADNTLIKDLKDFTATFFQKDTLLHVLLTYSVFDTSDTLLIMRPYQIAATESILRKIHSSNEMKNFGSINACGYIWHTTGSGKTLTSFKTARLATELDYIDKVIFVVDRKDLDYQTMKEYQKFQPNSVNGSNNTKELQRSIEENDDRIIVTTIQKLNKFITANPNHEAYAKKCVLIFDECHRSQFGKAQKRIKKAFKQYAFFGFTGTPIFPKNSLTGETTQEVFGEQLHNYVITDAIRDKKVLKFKVDYNYIKPEINKYREAEKAVGQELDEKKLKKMEKELLLHPERIATITEYLLRVYNTKTHRNQHYTHKQKQMSGFNAMLAVQSIEAAKLYYDELQRQQATLPETRRLKIATIFSFAPNEEQSAYGEIQDEELEPQDTAMPLSSKEFLSRAIDDYNQMFKTNFSTDGKEFQNYYRDLSKRVKSKEVDLLIVVGMFLTGFDAPTMNTLFVDKNLRYHGLIQAFSRTNRIFNKVKPFGNIVCFRDLEKATQEAIKTFGDTNKLEIILEKSFSEYMDGFVDQVTGIEVKGYTAVCQEILERFPNPQEIETEHEKKEFVKLFGELLKLDNVLRNYDEFQEIDKPISEGYLQDLRSAYVEIRDEFLNLKNYEKTKDLEVDLSDVEFEIELLKTDEINLDYILALIVEKSKNSESKEVMKAEVSRVIRSSIDIRAKEDLVLNFINYTDLSQLQNNESILTSFYTYAKKEKEDSIQKLADDEKLGKGYRLFIDKAIQKGYAESGGTDLDDIISPTSRRKGARELKKQQILAKLQKLVEIYRGI
mgnify:CR=1 FL=1